MKLPLSPKHNNYCACINVLPNNYVHLLLYRKCDTLQNKKIIEPPCSKFKKKNSKKCQTNQS